jgi:hypothetical protein
MRFIALIIYGLVLLFGTCLILQRTDAQRLAFRTKRALPANHLLQDGDIVPAPWYRADWLLGGPRASDFSGRYLTGAVLAEEAIRTDETAAVPLLRVAEPMILVAVPVSRDLINSQEADTGQNVTLCRRAASQEQHLRDVKRGHANQRPKRSTIVAPQATESDMYMQGKILAVLCPAAAPASCTALVKPDASAAQSNLTGSMARDTVVSFKAGDTRCR